MGNEDGNTIVDRDQIVVKATILRNEAPKDFEVVVDTRRAMMTAVATTVLAMPSATKAANADINTNEADTAGTVHRLTPATRTDVNSNAAERMRSNEVWKRRRSRRRKPRGTTVQCL